MSNARFFLSGLILMVIAYTGYISCVNQWPLEPITYCNTYVPFLGPCASLISQVGSVMFILTIFGALLIVYSIINFVWPRLRNVNITRHETSYQNTTGKKIATEIVGRRFENDIFKIALQRVDTTSPLRNKPIKVMIQNNILNLITNESGEIILKPKKFQKKMGMIQFKIVFEGDEYFKPTEYQYRERD